MQTEGAVDHLLEIRFGNIAADPVEPELLGFGAVELAVVGKEEVLGETGAESSRGPSRESSRARRPRSAGPGTDKTEETVAPDLGRETVGVDLDRIGRHVLADHDGGQPLPDPELGSQTPSSAEVGLGLRAPDVEEMTRVVEDVAADLDAPTGAARLRLSRSSTGAVMPGRRQPLGGHQTGQSTADDRGFSLDLHVDPTEPDQDGEHDDAPPHR